MRLPHPWYHWFKTFKVYEGKINSGGDNELVHDVSIYNCYSCNTSYRVTGKPRKASESEWKLIELIEE